MPKKPRVELIINTHYEKKWRIRCCGATLLLGALPSELGGTHESITVRKRGVQFFVTAANPDQEFLLYDAKFDKRPEKIYWWKEGGKTGTKEGAFLLCPWAGCVIRFDKWRKWFSVASSQGDFHCVITSKDDPTLVSVGHFGRQLKDAIQRSYR